jgi:chromosome segregation ATPase
MMSVFDKKLSLANEEAVMLDAKVSQLREDVESLQGEIATKTRLIAEKDAEIRKLLEDITLLRANVDTQRELREVAQSHHLSDYELLRTRITRMLEEQTALVADGLQALANGRLEVTEEFMERVRDSLENQRRSLDRKDE